MYNTKKILITINGVPQQLLGAETPQVAPSGDYHEVKTGVNGDKHFLAHNDVYDILTLVLKYDSPNIELLKALAKNHTEFSASYKDENTGLVYNSAKAGVRVIGTAKADEDQTFEIDFL